MNSFADFSSAAQSAQRANCCSSSCERHPPARVTWSTYFLYPSQFIMRPLHKGYRLIKLFGFAATSIWSHRTSPGPPQLLGARTECSWRSLPWYAKISPQPQLQSVVMLQLRIPCAPGRRSPAHRGCASQLTRIKSRSGLAPARPFQAPARAGVLAAGRILPRVHLFSTCFLRQHDRGKVGHNPVDLSW